MLQSALDTRRFATLDETVTDIKSGLLGAHLHGLYAVNPDASNDIWLQLFDLPAASVTLGTTTPKLTRKVPANGTLEISWSECPINFAGGLSIACTSDSDNNTAPSTDADDVQVEYAEK